VEGALLQHGGEKGAICVSTMAEAEFFAAAGFEDITLAFPLDPAKIERAAALSRRIRSFAVLIDSPQALDAIVRSQLERPLDLFLKVDCGYHRAGVDPESAAASELAVRIASSVAVRFRGLLTHAGHSYHAGSKEELRSIARQETSALTRFATLLKSRGVAVPVRSVGSTPTASVVDRFDDCDEVRPGNYLFYDAYQSALGSCSLGDCAQSVLTTVVGVYPDQRKLIVDAGSLALSREAPFSADGGYGIVRDEGLRALPLGVSSLSQEHGQLFATGDFPVESIPVGTRLRIIPNHSCITAALFDRYHLVKEGRVVAEWRPVRGW
jgi:D-serine deaminase-like pyridoxal phosphate-dependent protein